MGSFATSRKKIWNFKFSEVNLTNDSGVLSFFQSQGINVHHLIFEDCDIGPELMKYIILHCVNLQSFAIFDLTGRNGQDINLAYVLDDFKVLRNDGVIRKHVTKFILQMPEYSHEDVSDAQFLNFFAVFPSIKKLKLKSMVTAVDSWSDVSSDMPNLRSNLSFPCLYYQLFKMRHQIEKLSLDLDFGDIEDRDDDFLEWKILSRIKMENLKKFSIPD